MKQPTTGTRGTTLVELIVCMALLGVFSVACIALLQPCAALFTEMQQQTRAQTLADAVLESLRGDLLQADGYIRFADADLTGSNPAQVFEKSAVYAQGSALEYHVPEGKAVVIDAGALPETVMTATGLTKPDNYSGATADIPNPIGTVHLRYFDMDSSKLTDSSGRPYTAQALRRLDPEDKARQIAYNYTDSYPLGAYMNGMRVQLHFYVRSYAGMGQSGILESPRISSLTVQVVVYTGPAADPNVLCIQKGIIPLPNEPILLENPNTWQFAWSNTP